MNMQRQNKVSLQPPMGAEIGIDGIRGAAAGIRAYLEALVGVSKAKSAEEKAFREEQAAAAATRLAERRQDWVEGEPAREKTAADEELARQKDLETHKAGLKPEETAKPGADVEMITWIIENRETMKKLEKEDPDLAAGIYRRAGMEDVIAKRGEEERKSIDARGGWDQKIQGQKGEQASDLEGKKQEGRMALEGKKQEGAKDLEGQRQEGRESLQQSQQQHEGAEGAADRESREKIAKWQKGAGEANNPFAFGPDFGRELTTEDTSFLTQFGKERWGTLRGNANTNPIVFYAMRNAARQMSQFDADDNDRWRKFSEQYEKLKNSPAYESLIRPYEDMLAPSMSEKEQQIFQRAGNEIVERLEATGDPTELIQMLTHTAFEQSDANNKRMITASMIVVNEGERLMQRVVDMAEIHGVDLGRTTGVLEWLNTRIRGKTTDDELASLVNELARFRLTIQQSFTGLQASDSERAEYIRQVTRVSEDEDYGLAKMKGMIDSAKSLLRVTFSMKLGAENLASDFSQAEWDEALKTSSFKEAGAWRNKLRGDREPIPGSESLSAKDESIDNSAVTNPDDDGGSQDLITGGIAYAKTQKDAGKDDDVIRTEITQMIEQANPDASPEEKKQAVDAIMKGLGGDGTQ